MEPSSAVSELELHRIPSGPRTPSPRARRLIFRYQAGQLVLLLMGLIFTAVGLAVMIPLCWGLPGELAITLARRDAVGLVIDTAVDYNVRVNGQHPTLIRYRYQDERGNDLVGESSTRDRDRIAAATPDAAVPIEIARWRSSYSRITGSSYSLLGLWGLLFLIMPAIGLSLTWLAVRSRRRRIRAFTDGRPIMARVSFAGLDTSVRINGRNPHKLCWEFELSGEIYEGTISSMSLLLVEDLMQRTEVPVLYDPMDPAVNTLYVA